MFKSIKDQPISNKSKQNNQHHRENSNVEYYVELNNNNSNSINNINRQKPVIKKQTENKKELNRFFCPMLDARRMEVYCALYDSQLKEVIPTCAKIIDETTIESFFIPYLENKNSLIFFFGEGAEKCKKYINHPRIAFIDNIHTSSQYMLPLAEKYFIENKF